ncbi:acyl-CoA ligase (AMP-forming), exosortase A system-associated [Lysobacter yananisis]|uniref:Acyl-CoA ligase (AMP-forming), exosortase A system-associated n=1 Tax=Lysobacter yananisis TaxID=1003114 RepID=A0ABY9P564_9GAMM|nr:acyl-CoA ligase (AMP-forming), exosortase A system-associated [Lysobacter yananisis]WMT02180.1 acyl-CoA ligase (AMP-forming), exosortase A system-associated [Lysobacter yananisis]
MITLLDALRRQARDVPDAIALEHDGETCSYARLARDVDALAAGLHGHGFQAGERIALYHDKSIRMVAMLLAILRAGCIAVPVNPKLKPAQVRHVLRDSDASALVATGLRAAELGRHKALGRARTLLTDSRPAAPDVAAAPALYWEDCLAADAAPPPAQPIDADVALLIYTSGSTGLPKGVVLSHRNLVAGAQSVVAYLGIDRDEVILGLLPLSFDAGFSQLSTALVAGARLVLHNYASARFVPALCAASRVSLITAIPPLWAQLAAAPWGEQARTVRTIANTGGHMPASLLRDLRAVFAQARPFLMYGLTEAFRSTYLDPAQIDRRPDSIGKAIPNAEILVLRPDGSRCDPGEHGELVHRGALVALGYWNDRAKTRERFRPLPRSLRRGALPEYAVWSGDIVRADEDGFLYFVGRRDELMKISGYRVSPTEIEKALMRFGGIREAVVFGVDDEALGTAPVALLVPQDPAFDLAAALAHCKRELAGYMVPRLAVCAALAHSANGKIDRAGSRELYLRMQAQAADAAPVPA